MSSRRYAFRRRPYRRPSAPKKYGKKYSRSRFQKKRFAKNNVNQLTMRAPLAARLLRVKLPWVKTFSVSSGTSPSFAFQGNGIVPYTDSGVTGYNVPAAGDSLPAGEVEYSSLYDKYFINGSSINVEAINSQNVGGATVVVRAVLLAIPFTVNHLNQPTNDDWASNKAQLDAYTYEQLLAWPFAKWRMLGANSGGASYMRMKMFRKTKSMCGLKDLRDNSQYGGQLTDGSVIPVDTFTNPRTGFMYYLRFFSAGTPTVEITVRMSLYCTLTNREFNPVQTITSPE